METKELAKVDFLGITNFDVYINDVTGEEVVVECTDEEYGLLSTAGASSNPKKEGHTWKFSIGGALKVDNGKGILRENEYCDYEGGAFVVCKKADGSFVGGKIATERIVDNKISLEELDNIS